MPPPLVGSQLVMLYEERSAKEAIRNEKQNWLEISSVKNILPRYTCYHKAVNIGDRLLAEREREGEKSRLE